MKCPNCGTNNPADETFCTNCGAYLSNSPTTTTQPAVMGGNTGATQFGGSGATGTPRTLTPNEKLQNGRYVIEKILGQGGMGAALLAKDSRVSNKLVVIKELISDNTDPEKRKEDVRNFEREVETVSNIDHPLVPNVTDYFQEGTRAFMVQEYVAGENLEDHMERINAPMPEREALGYASQVLDILDYLSQQTPPIVHRDIKPANIIIGAKDKRAHLVDFGIARADENKNAKRKQTSALGTPGYAPPEQYQGNADTRSDLYALAATIHHLVTNRDPRNYPPFSYPSARSLNPKLSPALDQVLTKDLTIDVTRRYQTPADMKRDVDNILAHTFNTSGDTSSYVLGTSGPIAATPPIAPRPAQPPRPFQPPTQAPQSAPPPRTTQRSPQQPLRSTNQPPPPPPQMGAYANRQQQQQVGAFANQPQRKGGSSTAGRNLGLLLLVLAVIAFAIFVAPSVLKSRTSSTTGSGGSTPTAATNFIMPADGLGVQPYGPNGDQIGISDGKFAFDTSGAGGGVKIQAAAAFKNGDASGAASGYRQAIATDSRDAESAIYLENQRAVNSGNYVTFVVATMLSSDNIGVGRDDLQGAYVAQKEYNDGAKLHGGTKVRLLVASSGSDKSFALKVAQQIVQLAKSDKTFAGVMGWPFSTRTEKALTILSDAKIPMVSQSSSADSLSGVSKYFFRVAPSNKVQGIEGAKYVASVLGAKKVVMFLDPLDAYSQSLAEDFTKQYQADGNTVIKPEQYTAGKTDNFPDLLKDALAQKPDLIYFSGYASDVSVLVTDLPKDSTVGVFGGDALYQLGGYNAASKAGFTRLKFSTFFYPDIWGFLGQNNSPQKPAFFDGYKAAFSGTGKGYGYDRADSDATLSYDATVALLTAYNIAAPASGGAITPDQLQQSLGKTVFQGASGQVKFDSNGDPVNKSIVILQVDSLGRISLAKQVGVFFK